MIKLRAETPELLPIYKTWQSSGADVKTKVDLILYPGSVTIAPTGVYIVTSIPTAGRVPELQVRLRSSLATRKIMLANGVGTIDADYRDEIGVMLYNAGTEVVRIPAGERVAQLVMALVPRLENIEVAIGERNGGFGSTGSR